MSLLDTLRSLFGGTRTNRNVPPPAQGAPNTWQNRLPQGGPPPRRGEHSGHGGPHQGGGGPNGQHHDH